MAIACKLLLNVTPPVPKLRHIHYYSLQFAFHNYTTTTTAHSFNEVVAAHFRSSVAGPKWWGGEAREARETCPIPGRMNRRNKGRNRRNSIPEYSSYSSSYVLHLGTSRKHLQEARINKEQAMSLPGAGSQLAKTALN